MDDGHFATPGTKPGDAAWMCARCADPWPCPAERQWQRIRDNLERASGTEADVARLRYSRGAR